MTTGVHRIRWRQEPEMGNGGRTWCEGCTRLAGGATRERLRQHVRDTGHTAYYVVEDITRYEPEG